MINVRESPFVSRYKKIKLVKYSFKNNRIVRWLIYSFIYSITKQFPFIKYLTLSERISYVATPHATS